MKKSNNTISDWLEKYGDPEIDKKVEKELERMTKEIYNTIIHDAYTDFLKNSVPHDRQETKDEFVKRIKSDKEFSERWGLKIEERVLSFKERKEILRQEHPLYFMEQQLGGEDIFTRNNIPTKELTLTYKNETITVYE